MKKVIRLTESDLMRIVKQVINESDAKVIGIKGKKLPSDATQAANMLNKYLSKLEKVNVRTAIGGEANLYKDLNNLSTSGTIAGSGLVTTKLGYAYRLKGTKDSLVGYKDWGTFNRDYVLVYVPDGNWKNTNFIQGKKFVGWNYVWTSQIAIL